MSEDLQGLVAPYAIQIDFEGTPEEVILHILFDDLLLQYLENKKLKISLVCKGKDEVIKKPQFTQYALMIYQSRQSGFWDKLSDETRAKFSNLANANKSSFAYDEQRRKRRSLADRDPILCARKLGAYILAKESQELLMEFFPDIPDHHTLHVIASLAVVYHMKKEEEKELAMLSM